MAKDKTPTELKERKEKKKDEKKKRKAAELDTDDAATPKKEKKDKKARKSMDADGDITLADAAVNGDDEEEGKKVVAVPLAALVPFANPLCDEKAQKKVLKTVKKAAKSKSLKRGVKECVKAIRKSPPGGPASSLNPSSLPSGIVVLAADISPLDVISHIPVLCEDHNIPYVYVPSRAELGAAGSTKRPTSVVMMTPKGGKKKGEEGGDEGEWEEAYKELFKVAMKLGQQVKV